MAHNLTWQSPQIIPEPNSGCWIWLGQTNQHGYGRTRLADGRSQVAHRAFYEAHHGVTVPSDLQVDHLCRLRCCVNPDHLEIVTGLENTRRAFRRIRPEGSLALCPSGHEMAGANVWTRKNGAGISRVCRTCARAQRAKYKTAQRLKRNAK